MIAGVDLNLDEPPIQDGREYRRVIGSLQYITMTHPDVQAAVNKLSQFMASPRPKHVAAMKRVLQFLAGTPTFGIIIRKAKDFHITAYCDADWGGDTLDRKSRTRMLVYLGGSLVSWTSRKQGTLARSSTEAEYRAVATITQEVESVRSTLQELGVQVPRPIKILTDNIGASFIAKNPIAHSKLKHVALDLHFVREKAENGEIIVIHIPSEEQWADILTKALPPKAFLRLQSKLVGKPPEVERGGVLDSYLVS